MIILLIKTKSMKIKGFYFFNSEFKGNNNQNN